MRLYVSASTGREQVRLGPVGRGEEAEKILLKTSPVSFKGIVIFANFKFIRHRKANFMKELTGIIRAKISRQEISDIVFFCGNL